MSRAWNTRIEQNLYLPPEFYSPRSPCIINHGLLSLSCLKRHETKCAIIVFAGPREAHNPNLDSNQRIAYYACAPCLWHGRWNQKLKFCSATKNDQNAKNVSITTDCHWDRSFCDTYRRTFCWHCEASFEDFKRPEVVEASLEEFERNWIFYGLFFKVSYILLNADYCCVRLNLLETTFTFWRSRLACFDWRSRSWSIEHCTENAAKFSKSSAADVPFISKRKRQNDFFGILIQFGHLVVLAHESNQTTAQFCQNLTPFGQHKSDQLKLFNQRQSLN